VRFNLAHSADAALIAIAHDREVGVDLERIRHDVESLKLAERFFSPDECERLRHLPDDEANRLFFTLWTCKEAYLKAIGTGLSVELYRFEALRVLGELTARVRLLRDSLPHEDWLFGYCRSGQTMPRPLPRRVKTGESASGSGPNNDQRRDTGPSSPSSAG